MHISDYFENILLNELFGQTVWPARPSNLYFALATTAPTDSTPGTEVSGSGYARVAVACSTAGFTVGGSTTALGSVTNAAAISWPQATGSWGTVSHFMVFDAASGGNMLLWGTLSTPRAVATGDGVTIAIGAFSFTFSGNIGALAAHALNLYIFNYATVTSVLTTLTGLATLYMRLGTAATLNTLSGEPGSGSYAAKSITNDASSWSAASAGQKLNNGAITFAAATAAWGSLTHFIIADHATTVSARVVWFGALDAPVSPVSTDTPTFAAAGALTLTLD